MLFSVRIRMEKLCLPGFSSSFPRSAQTVCKICCRSRFLASGDHMPAVEREMENRRATWLGDGRRGRGHDRRWFAIRHLPFAICHSPFAITSSFVSFRQLWILKLGELIATHSDRNSCLAFIETGSCRSKIHIVKKRCIKFSPFRLPWLSRFRVYLACAYK